MLTPWEAEEARDDCHAALYGAAAGVMMVCGSQAMAALLRFIWWLQS